MFIYLGLNLVTVEIIDLPDLRPGRNGLAQHHIQKTEFPVNRSLDGQIVFPPADHKHILAHIVQALLHLVNLHGPVQTVLLRPVLDQLQLARSQFIILLGSQIILTCNQLLLIQRLVLQIFTSKPVDIRLELELVLPQ